MKDAVRHGGLYAADLNPRRKPARFGPLSCSRPTSSTASAIPRDGSSGARLASTGESLLRVHLPRGIAGNLTDCEVMIDQSRTIDNARFKKRLGSIPDLVLQEIKTKLRSLGDP